MKHYNQTTPPELKLDNINQNIHLFTGDTDKLGDPVDAVRLYKELVNS